MNEKILEQLEYDRIKTSISSFCVSEDGKNAFDAIKPYSDENLIEKKKNLSYEWTYLLNFTNSIRLLSWQSISPGLEMLSVSNSCLTSNDCFAFAQFCRSVQNLSSVLKNEDLKISCPNFVAQVASLYDMSVPLEKISYLIDESGEIREVSEIRSIKSEIRKKHKEIESTIKSYLARPDLQDALQSEVPVLRSGRQVLALKSGARGKIRGIVHEVSQTGNTSYIEPEEVVQFSNELVELESSLIRKIRELLSSLTENLRCYKDQFTHNLYIMTNFDCAYACARWGVVNKCSFARSCNFLEGENLTLIKAYHPLLGKKAVPIDVCFPGNVKVLIITGANTGGKTVTLKTIALFALLNQSGFPIPASDGCVLPIFNEVFADIGDEQSMDENLSTFSAHMKNVAFALENADEKSLVLLDELGSGTDPQEGSAIAMAVLDSLIEKGCYVILTSHHGAIKNYGYTHSSCINASVEFDDETLSPTYKIIMGVPGSSHAFAIAEHSGIPDSIVQNAKSYIETNQTDVAFLIRGLSEKYAEVSKLENSLKEKENEINEKWRKVDLKNLQLKQHELELRNQGWKESKNFLDESRKMLENLVRELKEGEVTREKTLKVKETISNLEKSVQKEEENLKNAEFEIQKILNEENVLQKEEKLFEEGEIVLYGNKKTQATVIKKLKKNVYLIQAGSITLNVKSSELQKCQKDQKDSNCTGSEKSSDKYSGAGKEYSEVYSGYSEYNENSEKPVFELRLLGMRYEQAIKALEKQLDLCCIHNFKSFSVIHGKGEGILQKAVWDYLAKYPFVSEFHFATPEDGGSGKTYVQLQ